MNLRPNIQTENLEDPTNYYFFKEYFSNEEIEKIKEIASKRTKIVGSVGGQVVKSYRDSSVRWISLEDDSFWIFDKIEKAILEANNLYKMILTHLEDDIQFTSYKSESQQHYDWHLDVGGGNSSKRKLSCIVQLSSREEYDGGDFLIKRSKEEEILPSGKGDCILFPSYILHKVTPVTRGERLSLVTWSGGTHFY